MKITKHQLKRIIKESLEEEMYVVIGNAGRGRQNLWPKSDEPEAYSKIEASQLSDDLNSRQGRGLSTIHYHVKPLSQAIKYVSPGNLARTGLLNLMRQHGIE